MKLRPYVLFLLFTTALLFTSAAAPAMQQRTQEVKVYICNSKESVAYHNNKSCKGLQKCTHEVLSATQQQAEETYNRRPCKMCY